LDTVFEHVFSAHPSPHHDLSRAINAREAAYVLAQVDPENSDLHGLLLSSSGIGNLNLPGGGAGHPITSVLHAEKKGGGWKMQSWLTGD
jgi:hypothetical protein